MTLAIPEPYPDTDTELDTETDDSDDDDAGGVSGGSDSDDNGGGDKIQVLGGRRGTLGKSYGRALSPVVKRGSGHIVCSPGPYLRNKQKQRGGSR